ncbi:MAG TPA: hypothetical protein VF528_15990 [Pyrinomonadaceae bacterium]
MGEKLTLAAFAENLQTKFQASTEELKAVELLMVSAEDKGSGEHEEQFSIIFRGPLDTFLNQRTYMMEHPRMGTFPIFLVPIRRDQDGFYYEAAFARML